MNLCVHEAKREQVHLRKQWKKPVRRPTANVNKFAVSAQPPPHFSIMPNYRNCCHTNPNVGCSYLFFKVTDRGRYWSKSNSYVCHVILCHCHCLIWYVCFQADEMWVRNEKMRCNNWIQFNRPNPIMASQPYSHYNRKSLTVSQSL